MKRAVVLLSGGLDSATVLAIARSEGFKTYALSFDYAQRHRRELDFARKVAASLGAEKHMVIKFDMSEIGGSALTSDIDVPKDSAAGAVDASGVPGDSSASGQSGGPSVAVGQFAATGLADPVIPVTYVPARNTIFLSFALAWAETLGAPDIFIGANAVDYSGYPDCRPEYLRSFEATANLATKAAVEGRMKFTVRAPLIKLTKGGIIRLGLSLGVDYSETWSCYDPRPDGKPCMRCDSCAFRAKGFLEARVDDPILS
jgi:7-cyano-7-deazaguanine synthase